MIKSVIFLFFFLISFLNNNQEDEILKIIKGKQYSVHVKSELSFVNIHIPSGGVLRDKAVGVIFRNKEQFNLKTNNSIAIQEDSLFFILDPVLLIASLLKVESLGASILPLSLDPWDILNFCENNSKSKLIMR